MQYNILSKKILENL